ncbi:MAG TPA: hypothetical protein VN736_15155 [Candidatus Limnocylindrales bacterium]|nr:hypothetical protein [Candidatus Limnocylindrales bacterium]
MMGQQQAVSRKAIDHNSRNQFNPLIFMLVELPVGGNLDVPNALFLQSDSIRSGTLGLLRHLVWQFIEFARPMEFKNNIGSLYQAAVPQD